MCGSKRNGKAYDEKDEVEEYFKNERDRKCKGLMINLNEYYTKSNGNYSNVKDFDEEWDDEEVIINDGQDSHCKVHVTMNGFVLDDIS